MAPKAKKSFYILSSKCISPHPLEWGSEIDGVSTIDIPAKESHFHGWICKFFNFSHFSSFSLIFHFDVFLGM